VIQSDLRRYIKGSSISEAFFRVHSFKTQQSDTNIQHGSHEIQTIVYRISFPFVMAYISAVIMADVLHNLYISII
jgi:hypothetical protein